MAITESTKSYPTKRSAAPAGKSVFPDAQHFVETDGKRTPA